ncbi:sigma-70 family RNA polymerase sigma factor [Nocardia alni]|uniref:sigma-70 family RNA polymerase sigma factor n=1 Tax=Nocardia alni TaxID=2815723 RepID=UPI0027E11E5D|nr:sigma-70 family RNA polymerase sigma factor [Nocardia alni]
MTNRQQGSATRTESMRIVYDHHAGALRHYVAGLVHDSGAAEDIVQETLLRTWQHHRILDDSSMSARAWLYRVARNIVIDEYRRARNRYEIRTDSPPEQFTPDLSDRMLDSWLVGDALNCLPKDQRIVIQRAYYRDMTTHQIAAELRIPEGTVKSRMHYGMRALRRILDSMGVTP